MSDWKPDNYPSVSPYLISKDANALIDFLGSVFDATVTRRMDRPDGSVMHAELRIDDSIVMIGGGATDHQGAGVHVHVYVPDASSVYARAMQRNARSVQGPTRKRDDDDCRAGFADPDGNTWWVANQ
jgi:PhnB protein